MPRRSREPAAPKATSAKDWAKADRVTPQLTERLPSEISDGGGLGFDPQIFATPAAPLDPEDPAVRILIRQLDVVANGPQVTLPWKADPRSREELATLLEEWRLLAETEERRLFGKGAPPRLVTVGVKRERRNRWAITAVSPGRELRASRDSLRASSFRLDPDTPLSPEDTVLRLLVVERTRSGGRLAFGRFQPPDLYVGEDELLLRCFITPLEGWQAGTRPWETPLLVELPEPVGERQVTDGAVYFKGASRAPVKPAG
jgi:hypothetical protein